MTRNILDWICSARRYLASACAGALACTTLPATAMSATGEVYFGVNVTVNNACFIFVTQDGSLGTNVDATQMSSMLPGGASGVADVVAFSNYDVTVDSVPFFLTEPPGGSVGATFNAYFSGQSLFRGRNFAQQPGSTPVRLRSGFSSTRITVDLEVDKPDGFPTGNYETVTIVRCE